MQIRTGLWSLEAAKSWLRNYEWGEAIACTIEDNPDPLRQMDWICMVMDMEAVLSGSFGIHPAAAPSEVEHCADAVHT